MILHRLRLTNFRGVADREISFPEHGVVVVCGRNEIGKSSMLEALGLLTTYRDRSNHRDVKQVKPAHADVGAEVEAEISTGPYRFVYRKRFHKKYRTELEVIEPRRENLTGDEAHERAEAMLNETVDTKLWDAQRVLQSASTNAVNLSGCDALSRALDAAGGEVDAAGAGGADTGALLVDLVEAEYLKFFTATGRPTKDFKAAGDRLKAAEQEAERCRTLVADVNERVCRHEELTHSVHHLEAALGPANERLAAALRADAAVAEIAEQLSQARLVATAAAATSANSTLSNGARQQLVADAGRRAGTLAGLQTELTGAVEQEREARADAEAAAHQAALSTAALADAQQRLDDARSAAQACVAREEAERLAGRLTRIEETQAALAELTAQLSAITVTEALIAEIDKASATVERLEAALQAEAGTVQFVAPAALSVTIDGKPHTLSAGESWTHSAAAAVVVDVPGVLSVRIDPGATAAQLRAELLTARDSLAGALAKAGVSDPAGAHDINRRRGELVTSRGQACTALEVLCDGDDVEMLRTRLTQARAAVPEGGDSVDAEAVAVELAAAKQALDPVKAQAEVAQKAADDTAAALAEKIMQTRVFQERLTAAQDELAAVAEQLSTLRAAVSDDAVAAQAAADAEAQRVADAAVTALAERYEAADPAAVGAELAAATDSAQTLTGDRDAAKAELHTLTVELGVIGGEGRQGQLDDAEAALARAVLEHARIKERAEAAQLLRDTMIRHRDNTRKRYVQPYRTELERLGRTVFGPTFEVDLDTELTICSRTLDGRTVPFDSLSGGAKEQLGILARLAGAALVAKEDTVPVVIDDALGFSDPDRLDRMGAVFSAVGDRGQVIVLTCQPSRYRGIAGAQVIELSA